MNTPVVRYQKLTRVYGDSEGVGETYTSLQFKRPETKVPWRAIGIASVLFIVGSVLITIGILLLTGYISAEYR